MTWILTRTGRRFDLLDPQPEQINPIDIASALANLALFNGHTWPLYSVAQHSLLVAEMVPREHKPAALLHDATSAYLGNLINTAKQLPELKSVFVIERKIWTVICERFRLDSELPNCVKQAELTALATERRDLMPACPDLEYLEGIEPLPRRIAAGPADRVYTRYLDQLLEYLDSRAYWRARK